MLAGGASTAVMFVIAGNRRYDALESL